MIEHYVDLSVIKNIFLMKGITDMLIYHIDIAKS